MEIKKNYILILFFLFLVIIISAFVLSQEFEKWQVQEELLNAENEKKAELLAKKTTEVKIIEKLSEIYAEEKVCSSSELIDQLNFVNTFSFATGISVQVPSSETEAKKVIEEANNCIPEISKKVEQIPHGYYLVYYTSVFSEECSLTEKEMQLIIKTDPKELTAEVIEGELDEQTKNVLGNNLFLLDSFGN